LAYTTLSADIELQTNKNILRQYLVTYTADTWYKETNTTGRFGMVRGKALCHVGMWYTLVPGRIKQSFTEFEKLGSVS
jgi:hypothetical protein